jgi:hypothetical protein
MTIVITTKKKVKRTTTIKSDANESVWDNSVNYWDEYQIPRPMYVPPKPKWEEIMKDEHNEW